MLDNRLGPLHLWGIGEPTALKFSVLDPRKAAISQGR